jgi:tRNA threonylcarbamoyladenosine biosynthesis protein TsaE
VELQPLPAANGFPLRRGVRSAAEAADLAWRAGRELLAGGEILLLWGPLGAGKTHFVQALCRGLGIEDEVTSPSFTLAGRYAGRLVLHHLDFYRVPHAADLADIGVEAILDEVEAEAAVLVAEWPWPLLPLVPRRLELLILPGAGLQEREWHLRGAPPPPDAWRAWLLGAPEG